MRIALVILNYNGIKHLQAYLTEIKQHIHEDDRLYIADNASEDGSVNWLRDHHPEVELILLEKNHGFAGGYKRALESIEAEYFVLINSDLKFTSCWYRPIISAMEEEPEIAAAQPKVLSMNQPEKFEYAGAAGGLLDRWAYPYCRGRIFDHCEVDEGQYDEHQEVFWATGAAMIVRARSYHELGGLDEMFFAHQEEIDLCWRLKRAGYKVMSYPQQTVYHLGGGTLSYGSPFKTYLNFRNSLLMMIKNEDSPLFFKLLWRMVLDGIAGLKFLLSGQARHCLSVLKAHGYVYAQIGRLLAVRKDLKVLVKQSGHASRAHIGRSGQSIIWHYYIKGIKTVADLVKS